ncbi:lipopolysaccharide biosynthesis protein [Paenibacillus sp. NPDC058071]|uniref:lipopolysaccharide biosynthesis protein n=1 Tax=Paenibacillus sp. NPDC058071 TaxID=3346326 RepID=UPI0036DC59E8
MRKYLKFFPLDHFFKNVLVLAGGTIISQVIVLASLPIITRIYSPADYGTYSLYTSIIAILLMTVSLSYENAITLPEDDKTASSILTLSLRICLVVSVLSGIAIYFVASPLAHWLKEPSMKNYFLFIIVGLFGAGFYQILNSWSVRKKYFKQLARTKYTQSIGQVSVQLGFSFMHIGPVGLIAGEIIGRFGGMLSQWGLWRKDVKQQNIVTTVQDLKDSAYRYRRFPMLSLASNVLNSIGLYLPLIMITAYYGPYTAGLMALGQRILGSPMTLIMTSVRHVYLSESSEYANNAPEKLYPLFLRTVRNVFIIGLLIILVIVILGPSTFAFLFGNEWEKSGHIIRILSIMYLSQFVANSVGTTIDVMERQDLHLYREIIRTVIIIGALLYGELSKQPAETAILYFSLASTVGYVLHLGLSWFSIKKFKGRENQYKERG